MSKSVMKQHKQKEKLNLTNDVSNCIDYIDTYDYKRLIHLLSKFAVLLATYWGNLARRRRCNYNKNEM